jgi:hypothetical protein
MAMCTSMRRLVTGVDALGCSCVVEETEFSIPISGEPIYQTDTAPPPVRPPGRGADLDLAVPPGFVRWAFAHFEPGQRGQMHMHHTDTLDLDTIIFGSIDLVLDDGPHRLEAGDCVVITGVDHEWLAGPEGCSWSVVMIGSPPLVE